MPKRNLTKVQKKRLTVKSLELEQRALEIVLMRRFSYGVLMIFTLSVFAALACVVLNGLNILHIPDTILYCLLLHSVFHIGPTLVVILRFIFREKSAK